MVYHKPGPKPRVAAPAAPPPDSPTRKAKVGSNAWWCPWDDRAMQHKDPCDKCGATLNPDRSTAVRTEQ